MLKLARDEADINQRKKARLSDSREDAKTLRATRPSHNESESESDDDFNGNSSPPRAAGSGTREDSQGSEENEDEREARAQEEMDTQRATQAILRRNEKTMENRPADNGVIESVTCINFMCHSKLHVVLGPLINFIIGHNGSGKSAVLTALTLCLGGKAASTNRGQSLKSFIKEGQE